MRCREQTEIVVERKDFSRRAKNLGRVFMPAVATPPPQRARARACVCMCVYETHTDTGTHTGTS